MKRVSYIIVILSGISFILISFKFIEFFGTEKSSETPEIASIFEDKDVMLFLEAVNHIQMKGLFWDPGTPRAKILQNSLKSYLFRNDPFSDYLTRDEFHRFKQLQEEQFVGIGMEIQRDREGRIVCFPYPESPAQQTGIRSGDYLKQINGIPVSGKSVFTVAAMARCRNGTIINLVVLSKEGDEKELAVACEQLQIKSIEKRYLQGFAVIQIHAFTRTTKLKLESILSNWENNSPVIIDLRGNSGGDLDAAIDSAELFLRKGQRIITVENRPGTTVYNSKSAALDLAYPIYIWQDEATASAAEVFVGALTDNKQAVSIGKTTFGKGTKQDIIKLSDGSALILTTGRLNSPNGTGYQDQGLNPVCQLKNDNVDTADYVSKMKEITRSTSKHSVCRPYSSLDMRN